MRRTSASAGLLIGLGALALLVGCRQETSKDTLGKGSEKPPAAEKNGHPTEGPHHGSLIELGKEETLPSSSMTRRQGR